MQSAFSLIPSSVTNQLAIVEIVDCNKKTSRYGLIISQADALELVVTRSEALNNYGRIEFSGGIISKLILSFSNSPFLTKVIASLMMNLPIFFIHLEIWNLHFF